MSHHWHHILHSRPEYHPFGSRKDSQNIDYLCMSSRINSLSRVMKMWPVATLVNLLLEGMTRTLIGLDQTAGIEPTEEDLGQND